MTAASRQPPATPLLPEQGSHSGSGGGGGSKRVLVPAFLPPPRRLQRHPSSDRRGAVDSRFTNHDSRSCGFTLIEVLVALAIVAVTLLAGLRAVGTMAESGIELRLRLLAQVAAENRIAELRAARAFPGIGSRTVACPQGRMNFECVEETKATPNPLFRRIEVRVYADAGREHRLAELIGILPNEK
jgi:general secretion pathway protein I